MHDIDTKLVETFVGGTLMFVFYMILKLVFNFIEKMRTSGIKQSVNNQNETSPTLHFRLEHLDDKIDHLKDDLVRQLDDLKLVLNKHDERFIKLVETSVMQLEMTKSFIKTIMQFLKKYDVEK